MPERSEIDLGLRSALLGVCHDGEWHWAELEIVLGERWRWRRHRLLREIAGGACPPERLAAYAAAHADVLVAAADAAHRVASASDGLVADVLADHARHRDAQAAAWRRLVLAVGATGPGAGPAASTAACAEALSPVDGALGESVVALYCWAVIEAQLATLVGRHLDDVAGGPPAALGTAAGHDLGTLAAVLHGAFDRGDPFAILRRADALGLAYRHLLDDLDPLPSIPVQGLHD